MYTPQARQKAIQAVLKGLRAGTPLTVICSAEGMPADRTIREWTEADPELSAAIACARETGFDVIAADGLTIVDNIEEDPASRRVRSDYRLKLLAKWDPKRYGELLKHGNADGSNLDAVATLMAARERAGLGEG